MDKIVEIQITPTDESIRALGNINMEPSNAVFELFNNSIQAAIDNDKDLKINVCIDFEPSDRQTMNYISVKDFSGGIKRENMKAALTPSYCSGGKASLSEHGAGLKIALESLTKKDGTHKIISTTIDDCFSIEDRLSYEFKMKLKDFDRGDERAGLEVFIGDPRFPALSYPSRENSSDWNIWAQACKKYRYVYDDFTSRHKNFEINFKFTCGEDSTSRAFSPIKPVLKNPMTGKSDWLTDFELEEGGLKVHFKVGIADNDKSAYTSILPSGDKMYHDKHPYKLISKNVGFETIYNNVIIKEANLDDVPVVGSSVGSNGVQSMLLRGEMHVLEGGESFATKDGVKRTPELARIVARAVAIIKGKEAHPGLPEPVNYLNDYISSSNYVKGGVPAEVILKHRHRQMFENMNAKVSTEEYCKYGRVDMVVDLADGRWILEHKRKETKVDDILQVIKYMTAFKHTDDIVGYRLVAPSHSDSAIDFLEDVSKTFPHITGLKIMLQELPEMVMNSTLSPAEWSLQRRQGVK